MRNANVNNKPKGRYGMKTNTLTQSVLVVMLCLPVVALVVAFEQEIVDGIVLVLTDINPELPRQLVQWLGGSS